MIAIANGAVKTLCAITTDQSCPDIPNFESQASIASAIIIKGIVGGSKISAIYGPLKRKLYRKSE